MRRVPCAAAPRRRPRADRAPHSTQSSPHPHPKCWAHKVCQAALPEASSSAGRGGRAARREEGWCQPAPPRPRPHLGPLPWRPISPKPPGPQLGRSRFPTPRAGVRGPPGTSQEPHVFKAPDLTRTGSASHPLAPGRPTPPYSPPRGSYRNSAAPVRGNVGGTSHSSSGPSQKLTGPTNLIYFIFSLLLREFICSPLRTWQGPSGALLTRCSRMRLLQPLSASTAPCAPRPRNVRVRAARTAGPVTGKSMRTRSHPPPHRPLTGHRASKEAGGLLGGAQTPNPHHVGLDLIKPPTCRVSASI